MFYEKPERGRGEERERELALMDNWATSEQEGEWEWRIRKRRRVVSFERARDQEIIYGRAGKRERERKGIRNRLAHNRRPRGSRLRTLYPATVYQWFIFNCRESPTSRIIPRSLTCPLGLYARRQYTYGASPIYTHTHTHPDKLRHSNSLWTGTG